MIQPAFPCLHLFAPRRGRQLHAQQVSEPHPALLTCATLRKALLTARRPRSRLVQHCSMAKCYCDALVIVIEALCSLLHLQQCVYVSDTEALSDCVSRQSYYQVSSVLWALDHW